MWFFSFVVFSVMIEIDTDPYDWVAAEWWTVCYEIESVPGNVKNKVYFDKKSECKKYINLDFYN